MSDATVFASNPKPVRVESRAAEMARRVSHVLVEPVRFILTHVGAESREKTKRKILHPLRSVGLQQAHELERGHGFAHYRWGSMFRAGLAWDTRAWGHDKPASLDG